MPNTGRKSITNDRLLNNLCYLFFFFFWITRGGGDKKIESRKLEYNVTSKVGSTVNMQHKAGGGKVKVCRFIPLFPS